MSVPGFRSVCFVALVFAGASAPLLANGIRVVDHPSLPTFTSLQAAINAAPDGGMLLVQGGAYSGPAAILDKSITIVGMPGTSPSTGPITIMNLGSTKRVIVSNLEMYEYIGPAVRLRNNAGTVRFEDCRMTGGTGTSTAWGDPGAAGIEVEASQRVVLVSCEVYGGDANIYSGTVGLPGGPALSSVDSNVVLYDCSLRGGTCLQEGLPGGHGGDAIRVANWGLFASGCTLAGGAGGNGHCSSGGNGGDGLDVTNAIVRMLDSTLAGGAGGSNSCGGANGTAGLPVINNGGVVNQIAGTRRKLVADAVAADDSTLTITVTGQPGDSFYLLRSPVTAFAYQSQWHGVWTIPPISGAILRAVIPPSGMLTTQAQTRSLVGFSHQLEFLQGFCVDTAGQRWLTSPIQVELLDTVGGPDCDGSGVNDFVELIGGAPDCNRNVSLDTCDISAGTSTDANGNGIPDECPGG